MQATLTANTTLGVASPVQARHAEVVPSFIVPLIQRTLTCWIGSVEPEELLCWTRPGDLSDRARDELREAIVGRLRQRAAAVWSLPAGLQFSEGWRQRLTPAEAETLSAAVQALTRDGQSTQELTLQQIKNALHKPLATVLGLLARLEAGSWSPVVEVKSEAEVPAAKPALPYVEVDDALRAQAAEVLSWPWVQQLDAQDLRFAMPEGTAAAEWVAAQVRQLRVPRELPEVLKALSGAQSLTAAQELRALVEIALRRCKPRPQPGSETRWVGIFLMRYLSRSGSGATLDAVGQSYGLTRERVRVICNSMERALKMAPIATPALDRVLRGAARIAPCGVAEVNEQLAHFIGQGAGIESLLAWAQWLGRDSLPVHIVQSQVRMNGELVSVRMVEAAHTASWVPALLRYASRECANMGCSCVLRMAGLLALRDGVAPGQEAIESALTQAVDFRWLDQDLGWFTLGDTTSSASATRVKKIVAIAQVAVGTDEIAAAFASDDVWLYREERWAQAIPPVHVLRELFLGWPFVRVVQKSRFVASAPLDPKSVLSDSEALAVSVIEQHDGVASLQEIKTVVMAQLGCSAIAVSIMLGASPVIVKLEHRLYALRGRRLGGNALENARLRGQEKSLGAALPEGLRKDAFVVRVTEASLKNEQYSVPAKFSATLRGTLQPVRAPDGTVLGAARTTPSGAISGLNRCIGTLAVDDLLVVTARQDGLVLQHRPADRVPESMALEISTQD